MPWFSSPGTARPATVSVFARDGQRAGRSIGAGILLPGRRVLTAAHVINMALGRNEFEAARPAIKDRLTVRVGEHRRYAKVMVWIPARQRDALYWRGDLAVLQLLEPLPSTLEPPQWKRPAVDMPVCAWHPAGHHPEFSLAKSRVVAIPANGLFAVLDGSDTGANIQHGYSGGPIWSDKDRAVVGLVIAQVKGDADRPHDQDQVRRRSWCVTTQGVREELATEGAERLLDETYDEDDQLSASEYTELAGILNRRLNSRETLADCGRHVAQKCGLSHPRDGSAPTVDEFVRVLLTHPRALAELTDALYQHNPKVVSELVPAGWRIRHCLLLTFDERRWLNELLASLPYQTITMVPSLVRDAVPDIDLASALPSDAAWLDQATAGEALQALLDQLELHRRVSATDKKNSALLPALVCVALHVAAMAPPKQANELVKWSEKIVERALDKHDAIGDRLADAQARARRLRDPGRAVPRLFVQLTPTGEKGDAERFTLRIWRREESQWQRMSTDEEQSYDTARTVAEIFSKASTLIHTGTHPFIELAVSREGLELDPHAWEIPGPLGTHRELGVEYPVVISCPELLDRGSDFAAFLEERRKRLSTGVLLRIESSVSSLNDLYSRFAGDMNTVGAVVDEIEPALCRQIVQYCLAIGLPVVLWGRGENTWADACDHLAAAPPRHLPARVHQYRRSQWNKPTDGRPVLAWSDDTCPDLYLDDPSEESA
ncbi:VMAP-C domain-containing protein [Streptomyces sp. NPDC002402]